VSGGRKPVVCSGCGDAVAWTADGGTVCKHEHKGCPGPWVVL
jgi:hypothetical protein